MNPRYCISECLPSPNTSITTLMSTFCVISRDLRAGAARRRGGRWWLVTHPTPSKTRFMREGRWKEGELSTPQEGHDPKEGHGELVW